MKTFLVVLLLLIVKAFNFDKKEQDVLENLNTLISQKNSTQMSKEFLKQFNITVENNFFLNNRSFLEDKLQEIKNDTKSKLIEWKEIKQEIKILNENLKQNPTDSELIKKEILSQKQAIDALKKVKEENEKEIKYLKGLINSFKNPQDKNYIPKIVKNKFTSIISNRLNREANLNSEKKVQSSNGNNNKFQDKENDSSVILGKITEMTNNLTNTKEIIYKNSINLDKLPKVKMVNGELVISSSETSPIIKKIKTSPPFEPSNSNSKNMDKEVDLKTGNVKDNVNEKEEEKEKEVVLNKLTCLSDGPNKQHFSMNEEYCKILNGLYVDMQLQDSIKYNFKTRKLIDYDCFSDECEYIILIQFSDDKTKVFSTRLNSNEVQYYFEVSVNPNYIKVKDFYQGINTKDVLFSYLYDPIVYIINNIPVKGKYTVNVSIEGKSYDSLGVVEIERLKKMIGSFYLLDERLTVHWSNIRYISNLERKTINKDYLMRFKETEEIDNVNKYDFILIGLLLVSLSLLVSLYVSSYLYDFMFKNPKKPNYSLLVTYPRIKNILFYDDESYIKLQNNEILNSYTIPDNKFLENSLKELLVSKDERFAKIKEVTNKTILEIQELVFEYQKFSITSLIRNSIFLSISALICYSFTKGLVYLKVISDPILIGCWFASAFSLILVNK